MASLGFSTMMFLSRRFGIGREIVSGHIFPQLAPLFCLNRHLSTINWGQNSYFQKYRLFIDERQAFRVSYYFSQITGSS
jgi:hypothetical protein